MDENADALTFEKYCMIFQGLADCLACRGHCLEVNDFFSLTLSFSLSVFLFIIILFYLFIYFFAL